MAEIDGVQPTPEKAEEQQADSSWPKPGEEGYVHPDGTPQSVQQLEDNRRAAADRAAAGSVVHGAPLATPGPDVQTERDKAVERAESYDGTTAEQGEKNLTEWIETKTEEKADEAADDDGEQAKPAARRTRASRSADAKKE
ncbi:hypothetical protein [Streptosporangium saharense]|uniref:hypothetical protein n=1 Tax=Streptosporangium saharense TaxID=1706840 RepID=UPI003440C68D